MHTITQREANYRAAIATFAITIYFVLNATWPHWLLLAAVVVGILSILVLFAFFHEIAGYWPSSLLALLSAVLAGVAGYVWNNGLFFMDPPYWPVPLPPQLYPFFAVSIWGLAGCAAFVAAILRIFQEMQPGVRFSGVWSRFDWEMLLPMAVFGGAYGAFGGERFVGLMLLAVCMVVQSRWRPIIKIYPPVLA
ncbi:MAG: hypothetical protein V4474_00845 [Patescibacteria group bacterium]